MLEQSDSADELDDVEELFFEPPATGEETDEMLLSKTIVLEVKRIICLEGNSKLVLKQWYEVVNVLVVIILKMSNQIIIKLVTVNNYRRRKIKLKQYLH